jgi:hypothetical protein
LFPGLQSRHARQADRRHLPCVQREPMISSDRLGDDLKRVAKALQPLHLR